MRRAYDDVAVGTAPAAGAPRKFGHTAPPGRRRAKVPAFVRESCRNRGLPFVGEARPMERNTHTPMPRYAALIYGTEETGDPNPELWGKIMAEYMHFGEVAGAAGVIGGGEALQPTNVATTIQATDGPFAETKEALGGLLVLDCKDLDEALSWAAQIPGAWHGRVEVRPVIDMSEMG
jgi:hypothetical protein